MPATQRFSNWMPNVFTDDVARALDFYRDVLGFQETFRFPEEGRPLHVELRLGGSVLAISHGGEVVEMGLPAPIWGSHHELVLWCRDVDGTVGELRDAGVPILVEPFQHVAGHRRAYAADPDGNWLALVGG
ncbi:MAG TPA: VOC family protein [Candidatus Dormibacteraeota bacterium]|nr:VOC family protein [Candidatus Dormibacteraeota bacterium]